MFSWASIPYRWSLADEANIVRPLNSALGPGSIAWLVRKEGKLRKDGTLLSRLAMPIVVVHRHSWQTYLHNGRVGICSPNRLIRRSVEFSSHRECLRL